MKQFSLEEIKKRIRRYETEKIDVFSDAPGLIAYLPNFKLRSGIYCGLGLKHGEHLNRGTPCNPVPLTDDRYDCIRCENYPALNKILTLANSDDFKRSMGLEPSEVEPIRLIDLAYKGCSERQQKAFTFAEQVVTYQRQYQEGSLPRIVSRAKFPSFMRG